MTENLHPLTCPTPASCVVGTSGEIDGRRRTGQRDFDGRWTVAAIVATFAGGLIWALASGPNDAVWWNVGVIPMHGIFEDLYPFVAAQKTLELGGEIYTPMAVERWGRPYNYPVLWLTFMRYNEAAIPFIGAGMIVAWFAALATACGRLTARQGWIIGGLSCSPAVVLALERANTDVIIFCLAVAAIALLGRGRTIAAWTGLTVATTLKLFPLFAFGVFLRLGWQRAWPWLVSAVIATAVFTGIQFEQIQGVLRETPRGGIFSYGAAVWVDVANGMYQRRSGVAGVFDAYRTLSMLCAGLLVLTAFVAGARHSPPTCRSPDQPDASLDYFRAGAGVFLATFVLGSHFNYRLIFLLLCVPWVSRPLETGDRMLVWGRRVCLVMVVIGLWSNPHWWFNLYYVRELALWTNAIALAWLLGRTLPAHVFLAPGRRATTASHAASPTV